MKYSEIDVLILKVSNFFFGKGGKGIEFYIIMDVYQAIPSVCTIRLM